MTFYKLYHKDAQGFHSVNHYFNELENEHPLATARRMLHSLYRGRYPLPEFKKQAEGRWRVNGTHPHPIFREVSGVWYLERDE